MKPYPYWVALVLVLVAPLASAELDRWELDSQAAGVQAIVMHQYPSETLPIGESFFVSIVASGSQDNSDVFAFGSVTASGCTVLDSAVTNGTTATRGLWLELRQDGSVCSWWVPITITDSGIGGGTAAVFRVTGTTAAASNVEFSNGGSFGGAGFWLPVLVFLAIFLWGGYTNQHMVTFAGMAGVALAFVDGAQAWVPFVLLLALLAAYIPSIGTVWSKLRETR